MTDFFKRLAAPFPAEEIQWRIGRTSDKNGKLMGMALAYYDARALYDRLDDVCGPENWQCRYPQANGKTTCEIGIRISSNEWLWKSNGAGDTDFEAEKGAYSDAIKRAGVPWGIGRYLYQMKNTWVECEKRGNSTVIKDSEYKKLEEAYKRFLKSGVLPSISQAVAEGNGRSGNKAINKAVNDALGLIKNCVDIESTMNVGRYQWKELKDSGAHEDQLALIQQQVENHCEFLQAKGIQA